MEDFEDIITFDDGIDDEDAVAPFEDDAYEAMGAEDAGFEDFIFGEA